VVPTLREQKRQILLAHMSVGLVWFADLSSLGIPSRLHKRKHLEILCYSPVMG
jgi:hypothetical protein